DMGALYARWYGPVFNERRFAENWVFVPAGFIAAPSYQRVIIRDPVRIVNIIHQTRNVTNYTVVNNIVVNKSVDVRVVERATGHPVPVMHAAAVIRNPNLVARVDVGQRVQMRMREIVPHGRGIADSAPPPPPRIIAKLSTNVTPRNGRPPGHLFTKATVTAPEAQSRFHGAPVRGTAAEPGGQAGGAMNGPNTERMRNEQPNGAASSGGERMRNEEPKGPTAPDSERMRNEQPNGPTNPGGERMRNEQPNEPTDPARERTRPQQPNGMTAPNAERPGPQQPNGMTGPNAERPRPQQPNGVNGRNNNTNPQN